MKSLLISTAIILTIGIGGAWAERAFSALTAAAAHKTATMAPA